MTDRELAPTGDGELRASPLELFFDLVFVFVITQLTASLAHHLTPGGLARVLVMLAVIWWMYDAYIWVANAVPPRTHGQRGLMLLGMGCFLVIALSVPRAFDGGGEAFGWAYLLVIAVHTGMFATAGVRPGAVARMGALNLLGAGLVIAGGYLRGGPELLLWTAAFGLQLVIPYLVDLPRFQLRSDHFVERHGLVVIVAFGESVIAIGVGIGEARLTPAPATTAILALAVCVGLWWAYFGADDEEKAVHAMARLDDARRNLAAIKVYNLGHYALLLAVILFATGAKTATAHPTSPIHLPEALALSGGTALFLCANTGIRRTLALGPTRLRLLTAALVLAITPLGTQLNPLTQLATTTVLLALLFHTEARRQPAPERPIAEQRHHDSEELGDRHPPGVLAVDEMG
ncbi:low temperature requirement protein A [Kitasatospora phosalacinea]|uniref:Low temperature requirement protein A n=1 Tax=Kitasatospora phosalacinea TaxID=2065 RepID=A0A9W6UNR5_9ACTN|nr:low temperature requirement protein A [Kitasatospora phosalacinea]GLW54583.1 low temperature requirement protein A [Kitasatospora phosalacinea]